jgi:hypothetical protein
MRRKHNPLVALLALLLLAIVLTFVLDGCAVETEAARNETPPRFTMEGAGIDCFIITDHETGVQYLMYRDGTLDGRGIGLCKLEVAP